MCKAFKKKSAEERKKEMAELMGKLEEGVRDIFDSAEYSNYLRTMSKFRHYSLNNQLLIWCQCPQATAVAGFNDWKKKFGRSVKKGEHGIKILAPMPIKIKAEVMHSELIRNRIASNMWHRGVLKNLCRS